MKPIKISLAQFHPGLAQGCIAHGQVEKEIRHPKQMQILSARLFQIGKPGPVLDNPLLRACEICGFHRPQMRARYRHAGGKRLRQVWNLQPRQGVDCAHG